MISIFYKRKDNNMERKSKIICRSLSIILMLTVIFVNLLLIGESKFEKAGYHYYCSNCGDTIYRSFIPSLNDVGKDYCPYCGSKKDEEGYPILQRNYICSDCNKPASGRWDLYCKECGGEIKMIEYKNIPVNTITSIPIRLYMLFIEMI